MRNEKTSKRVARNASWLMREADEIVKRAKLRLSTAKINLVHAKLLSRAIKSVAASALTQAPDRKKR